MKEFLQETNFEDDYNVDTATEDQKKLLAKYQRWAEVDAKRAEREDSGVGFQ